MKKISFITTLILLTISHVVNAQKSGDLDTSFSKDGIFTLTFSAVAYEVYMAIQTDGKIVLAGTVGSGSTLVTGLVRTYSNGTLDSSFGKNGIVISNNSGVTVGGVVLQPDGKILVAGHKGGFQKEDFLIERYKTNGTFDSTFSNDGWQTTDIGGTTDLASSIVLQSDGKIALGGYSINGTKIDFALARYNKDGSLDTSFSSDGKLTTTLSSGKGRDEIFSLAIDKNNKIVAAGAASLNYALVRYNGNGSLDTSFSKDGKLVIKMGDYESEAKSVIIQSDGKIIAAGYSNHYEDNFNVARFNADGTLDTSFNAGGFVWISFYYFKNKKLHAYANSIVLQDDGKFVVGGTGNKPGISNTNEFALARLNTDGRLDATFGTDGQVLTKFGPADVIYSLAIQKDGKIIAGGKSSFNAPNDFAVARYWEKTNCSKSISTQPKNILANTGTSVNFTISSTATTFQWQLKQSSAWQNITNTGQYTGATSSTLTIKNLTSTNNNQSYRCIATSNPCSDTSAIGVLTVCSKSISIQPQNTQAYVGASVNFTIVSTASIFQWQLKQGSVWQNVTNTGQYTGATSNTLSIKNITSNNNNENYRCIATSNPCSDTSANSVLTVCSKSISSQPQNIQANAGASVNFTISSTASTFQWQLKQGSVWQNITSTGQYTGATSNTLTIKNLTSINNNQSYRCIASSNPCVDTSTGCILTVCSKSISTQPQNIQANAGASVNFTISSTASTFQWQLKQGSVWQNITNTGQYSGATSNTLTIKNLTSSNNNENYRCIATSNPCSDTSAIGVLSVCSKSISTQPQNTQANAGALANFTIVSTASTFQWQLKQGSDWQNIANTGQYTGATSNTLTIKNLTSANNNENYRCIALSGPCSDTSTEAILTIKSGGTEKLESISAFVLYPNPTNQNATLEYNLKFEEIISIFLSDINGRKIANFEMNEKHPAGKYSKVLNLPSNLTKGIYFIHIISSDNKLSIKFQKG